MYPKSTERLKSWHEGKDLKRWRTEGRNLSLILFPKGWTIKTFGKLDEDIVWEKISDRYPSITEYLAEFQDVCRKRGDKGDYWWELRACDYYDKFDALKIIYPDISSIPNFSFDDSGRYFSNTGYFVPQGDLSLLALLNSKVVWLHLTGISDFVRGGFLRLFTQNVDKIPIPKISMKYKENLYALSFSCQSNAEQRYALQQEFFRRIPDLGLAGQKNKLSNKLKNWWAFDNFDAFRKEVKKSLKQDIPLSERSEWEDWINRDKAEIIRLTAEIKGNEAEINRIVYDLFDLTKDEIALVEESISV